MDDYRWTERLIKIIPHNNEVWYQFTIKYHLKSWEGHKKSHRSSFLRTFCWSAVNKLSQHTLLCRTKCKYSCLCSRTWWFALSYLPLFWYPPLWIPCHQMMKWCFWAEGHNLSSFAWNNPQYRKWDRKNEGLFRKGKTSALLGLL